MSQIAEQEASKELVVGEGRPHPLLVRATVSTIFIQVGDQMVHLDIAEAYREILELVEFAENASKLDPPVILTSMTGNIVLAWQNGVLTYEASYKDDQYGESRLTLLEEYALLEFIRRVISSLQ